MRYTLLGEGSSDRALLRIIDWTLRRLDVAPITGTWADLRHSPWPTRDLAEKISAASLLYPCDVLFVHRDADNQGRKARVAEVAAAAERAVADCVPIIPVRMTEAWLLFDHHAIRTVADKPGSNAALALPRGVRAEVAADPKQLLDEAILQAASVTGRRLKQLRRDLPHRRYRVAELIEDFGPLEALPGYRAFRADVASWLEQHGALADAR